MKELKKLRIFISSPGDVKPERLIAKKVIDELNRIYSDYVCLETLMWEDFPLEATASFQSGIDYFIRNEKVDIAVFILWSRLGSTLGKEYVKQDGTLYKSGTEYEFDTMYALWQQTGSPNILVYVKDADFRYQNLNNVSELEEALRQNKDVKAFIEERFRDHETQTNYAYLQFGELATFEQRLRTHLSGLIRRRIGHVDYIREWEGNPYVGLNSYEFSQSSIFCGRKSVVYDIAGRLMKITDEGKCPSLMILGESGSGKSSLVKAGVLPFFINDSTRDDYRIVSMTPSQFNGNVYAGLVDCLAGCFPFLSESPYLKELRDGVDESYRFEHLGYALAGREKGTPTPILFLDQFEELFSDSRITERERRRALLLLRGLVSTQCIWCLFSMRSDFYNRFSQYADLGLIKQASVVVDIPAVGVAEITEIVREPARKANLKWEVNDYGDGLDKTIIGDAGRIRDLPLIEFALSELYNCRTGDLLTFEAYERIGRLGGAVVKYADGFYNGLSRSEQAVFCELLGAVMTVSPDGQGFMRKTSLKREVEKSKLHRELVDKLIAAHLFVSGKDCEGRATVTIVHEMLLTSWPVVERWAQEQREFLERNDYYEKRAQYWNASRRSKKELIAERSALLEAEYFVYAYGSRTTESTLHYLRQSLLRQRRKGLFGYLAGFVLLAVAWVATIAAWGADKENFEASFRANSEGLEFRYMMWGWLFVLFVVGYHALLRILGRPRYRTAALSVLFWGTALVATLAVSVGVYGATWSLAWYGIPLSLVFASTLFELRRRRLWRKRVFKPYLFADRIEQLVRDCAAVAAVLAVFVMLLGFGMTVQEKNERYESTIRVADELFDALNNVDLSAGDKIYLNEKRQKYLSDCFYDELMDTIPDDKEWQYALCLYNLKQPWNATAYLYSDVFWNHHFLHILCLMRAGKYASAELLLADYVENDRYDSWTWASTADLIWVAEKLGRFDLAEKLYGILERNDYAWQEHAAAWINRGHVELFAGNFEEAIADYRRARELLFEQNFYIRSEFVNDALDNVASDFAVFRWFGVGDREQMDRAAEALSLQVRRVYTSPSDSLTTDEVYSLLQGKWMGEDSTVRLEFDPGVLLCRYRCYQKEESGAFSEIGRVLTDCRFTRTGDGRLLWEELDQESDGIAVGELTELSDELFRVRIIDNGNEAERGRERTYYRMR